MSAGIPSVTTRVGGIPELVVDGETGVILAPEDETVLADALINLLTDDEKRVRLGSNARDRYRRAHTPAIMAEGIEEVFEFVLRKAKRSPLFDRQEK